MREPLLKLPGTIAALALSAAGFMRNSDGRIDIIVIEDAAGDERATKGQ